MRRLLTFTTLAILAVLSPGCRNEPRESPDVILLHTGRLRGNVVPADLPAPLQYYPVIAGYVKQVRAEAAKSGAKVILLDLGDSMEGSFASHVTDSANMVTFFNSLGYDAVSLSNLDNRISPETLALLKARVLNPFAGPDGRPATPGSTFFTTLKIDGLDVFLMPNFYGNTSLEAHPDRFPASFGPSAVSPHPLRDYAAVAAAAGPLPPGTLGILTWMKFENADQPPVAFLEELSRAGIDAITAHRVYGSSQRDVWEPGGFVNWPLPVSLNILRNNGGFALARMDLKRNGDSWRVLRHELLPMTLNTAPADQEIIRQIAAFAPAIQKADRTVANLPSSFNEDQILGAYLKSLTSLPGVSAVLASRQSIRSDWPPGELRASGVFHSLPWTTPLVALELNISQILAVAKDLDLQGLILAHATGDRLVVAMPEFFARIIVARLQLDPSSPRQLAGSEFDLFLDGLEKPGTLDPALPPGWVAVGGRPGTGETP
ncbi:MAG: hypothetical protein Fur0032_00190 [Terrimicrobiaceae bacterium]